MAGRPLRGPAVPVVIGFAFMMTITVVIALFIALPSAAVNLPVQPTGRPPAGAIAPGGVFTTYVFSGEVLAERD